MRGINGVREPVPTEDAEQIADFISRAAAIKAAMQDTGFHRTHEFNAGCARAANRLKAIPAADVAPVVHAEWIEWFPGDCALIMTGEEMLWECSHCTAKYAERSNYCPSCGAKMDGGAKDAVDRR